jgi:hypothetical protein
VMLLYGPYIEAHYIRYIRQSETFYQNIFNLRKEARNNYFKWEVYIVSVGQERSSKETNIVTSRMVRVTGSSSNDWIYWH